MKKLILSIFLGLFLFGAADLCAQYTPKEAFEIIENHLNNTQTTTVATLSKVTLGGGSEATSTSAAATVENGERFLFAELQKAVLEESSLTEALNSVVARYENSPKNLPVTEFKTTAEQLLSI